MGGNQQSLAWDIFWRTLENLPEFYGQSWQSLAVLVTAAGLTWWTTRRHVLGSTDGVVNTGLASHLWSEVKPLLAGGAVILTGVVLLSVVQAVRDRDGALQERIRDLEKPKAEGPSADDMKLRDQIAELGRQLTDLKLVNQQLEQELARESERADREKSRADELQTELDDRAERRAKLGEVLKLTTEGAQLRQQLFVKPPRPQAITNFDAWVKTAPQRLRSLNLAVCADAFENPIHGARIGYGLDEAYDRRAFAAIALVQSLRDCQASLQ